MDNNKINHIDRSLTNCRRKLRQMSDILEKHDISQSFVFACGVFYMMFNNNPISRRFVFPMVGVNILSFVLLRLSRQALDDKSNAYFTRESLAPSFMKKDDIEMYDCENDPLIQNNNFLFGPYIWWALPKENRE